MSYELNKITEHADYGRDEASRKAVDNVVRSALIWRTRIRVTKVEKK